MGATQGPRHLLLLDEPPADYLVDGRFHKGCRDRFSLPVSLAKVRYELSIVVNVRLKLANALAQFLCRTAVRLNQTQVHDQITQTLQRLLRVSVPEQMFHAAQALGYVSAGLGPLLLQGLGLLLQHVTRMVMWNQSIRCSLCGCRYSCTRRTSSPPSDMNTTCWFSCIPCDFSSSHKRRRGFSSYVCTNPKYFADGTSRSSSRR